MAQYWESKPPWCQPWSIVLTGAVIILACWLMIKNIVLTLFVSAGVIIWWYLFLVIAPNLYAETYQRYPYNDTNE